MSWTNYNPQNNQNPQDSIGENHNLLLEYFVDNVNDISSDPNNPIRIIIDTANLLLPKANLLLGNPQDDELNNLAFVAMVTTIMKKEDTKNEYLNMNGFSSGFMVIYNDIDSIIKGLTTNNIEATINSLKTVDSDISSSSIDSSEKTLLYQVNSIARYSSAYWVTEKLDTDSAWITISGERGGSFGNQASQPPDWVYSDLKGAWLGAFTTANPLVALGGGALASAADVVLDIGRDNDWW